LGTGGSCLEAKWPEREADLSAPTNAEIKNDGAIPPQLHPFLLLFLFISTFLFRLLCGLLMFFKTLLVFSTLCRFLNFKL
jgi:hypothetical protein